MKTTIFLSFIFLFINYGFNQVPNTVARVLIVASNNMVTNACGGCSNPWDLYDNNYKSLFATWNDIYSNSGMNYSVQIAGVIWDQTYNDQVTYQTNWNNMSNPSHPDLGKYHDMLDEFAADYLVLHSKHKSPNPDVSGYAPGGIPSSGPAVFWTNHPGAYVWAHEAGHKHGLGHCDGYRQTYDANGNYTEVVANVDNGFHTTMQYSGGVNCSNLFDGAIGWSSNFENMFADPNAYRQEPNTGLYWPMGDATRHANTIPDHENADGTIRRLFDTENDVVLTADFSLKQHDFADILAINSVTIESGFIVDEGAQMKISVGTQVLQKRGIPDNHHFILEDDKNVPESVEEMQLKLAVSRQELKVRLALPEKNEIRVAVYDIRGYIKADEVSFSGSEGINAFQVNLPKMEAGQYFVRFKIGDQVYYKKIVVG